MPMEESEFFISVNPVKLYSDKYLRHNNPFYFVENSNRAEHIYKPGVTRESVFDYLFEEKQIYGNKDNTFYSHLSNGWNGDRTAEAVNQFMLVMSVREFNKRNNTIDFVYDIELNNPYPAELNLSLQLDSITLVGANKDNSTGQLTDPQTLMYYNYINKSVNVINKYNHTMETIPNYVSNYKTDPLTLHIVPFSMIAAPKAVEDEDKMYNLRINPRTNTVVGPEEEIQLGFDFYNPNDGYKTLTYGSIPVNVTDITAGDKMSDEITNETYASLSVQYYKDVLTPTQHEGMEIVTYNNESYLSSKYDQYGVNSPTGPILLRQSTSLPLRTKDEVNIVNKYNHIYGRKVGKENNRHTKQGVYITENNLYMGLDATDIYDLKSL